MSIADPELMFWFPRHQITPPRSVVQRVVRAAGVAFLKGRMGGFMPLHWEGMVGVVGVHWRSEVGEVEATYEKNMSKVCLYFILIF